MVKIEQLLYLNHNLIQKRLGVILQILKTTNKLPLNVSEYISPLEKNKHISFPLPYRSFKKEKTSKKIIHYTPINIFLKVESDSAWPRDAATLGLAKAAFYKKISSVLYQEGRLVSKVHHNHIDIYNLYWFRLRLIINFEIRKPEVSPQTIKFIEASILSTREDIYKVIEANPSSASKESVESPKNDFSNNFLFALKFLSSSLFITESRAGGLNVSSFTLLYRAFWELVVFPNGSSEIFLAELYKFFEEKKTTQNEKGRALNTFCLLKFLVFLEKLLVDKSEQIHFFKTRAELRKRSFRDNEFLGLIFKFYLSSAVKKAKFDPEYNESILAFIKTALCKVQKGNFKKVLKIPGKCNRATIYKERHEKDDFKLRMEEVSIPGEVLEYSYLLNGLGKRFSNGFSKPSKEVVLEMLRKISLADKRKNKKLLLEDVEKETVLMKPKFAKNLCKLVRKLLPEGKVFRDELCGDRLIVLFDGSSPGADAVLQTIREKSENLDLIDLLE